MLTPAEADAEDRRHPAPAPPLGSWTFLYALVLATQVLLVAAFLYFQSRYA